MNLFNCHFQPPWWLRNPHLQTCYPRVIKFKSAVTQTTDIFELSDGDFIELVYTHCHSDHRVILLHGMEGSVRSPYIQLFIDGLHQAGFDTVTMQFRSCGEAVNRHKRFYNAADFSDLAELVGYLKQNEPEKKISAVGFSLGGSVLLHYLAQLTQLDTAVAISVPYDLKACIECLPVFYDRYFMHSMNRKRRLKAQLGIREYKQYKSVRAFDESVTAPDFGFSTAQDYYQKASPIHVLKTIKTATLLINAKDDPFVPRSSLPLPSDISEDVVTYWTEYGGHGGFISGGLPWRPKHGLLGRVIKFLRQDQAHA